MSKYFRMCWLAILVGVCGVVVGMVAGLVGEFYSIVWNNGGVLLTDTGLWIVFGGLLGFFIGDVIIALMKWFKR